MRGWKLEHWPRLLSQFGQCPFTFKVKDTHTQTHTCVCMDACLEQNKSKIMRNREGEGKSKTIENLMYIQKIL